MSIYFENLPNVHDLIENCIKQINHSHHSTTSLSGEVQENIEKRICHYVNQTAILSCHSLQFQNQFKDWIYAKLRTSTENKEFVIDPRKEPMNSHEIPQEHRIPQPRNDCNYTMSHPGNGTNDISRDYPKNHFDNFAYYNPYMPQQHSINQFTHGCESHWDRAIPVHNYENIPYNPYATQIYNCDPGNGFNHIPYSYAGVASRYTSVDHSNHQMHNNSYATNIQHTAIVDSWDPYKRHHLHPHLSNVPEASTKQAPSTIQNRSKQGNNNPLTQNISMTDSGMNMSVTTTCKSNRQGSSNNLNHRFDQKSMKSVTPAAGPEKRHQINNNTSNLSFPLVGSMKTITPEILEGKAGIQSNAAVQHKSQVTSGTFNTLRAAKGAKKRKLESSFTSSSKVPAKQRQRNPCRKKVDILLHSSVVEKPVSFEFSDPSVMVNASLTNRESPEMAKEVEKNPLHSVLIQRSNVRDNFGKVIHKKNYLFVPCIFTDMQYQQGIRLLSDGDINFDEANLYDRSNTNVLSYNHKNGIWRGSIRPNEYFKCNSSCKKGKDISTRVPYLSNMESRLWLQSIAANQAAQHLFPVQINRLLGTITRNITVTNSDLSPFLCRSKKRWEIGMLSHRNKKNGSRAGPKGGLITKTQALRASKEEVTRGYTANSLDQRAEKIIEEWQTMQQPFSLKNETGVPMIWDAVHGNLIPSSVNDDEYYIPPLELLTWLSKIHERQTQNLPDSEQGTPNTTMELISILKACLDLSDPSVLWKVPLIIAYPVITRLDNTSGTSDNNHYENTSWKIQVAIYANRLLSEATTLSLRVVMNALDRSSYRVTAPLYEPHAKGIQSKPPVFESCPYPIVCMNDADLLPDGGDELTKRKSNDKYFYGSKETSRDESRISAFTVPGIMKLLENHGTDTTLWKQVIEPKLRNTFKLDCMLHQQHAICWMMEMEQLSSKGARFGINSLLWEEREFIEGGKYYYSPSLGQLRLDPPFNRTVGGLLCDDMGLGKTIEILGLIVATLEELKTEASKSSPTYQTHATLLIVPPALAVQWQSEIMKATGNSLIVDYLDYKTGKIFRRSRGQDYHQFYITACSSTYEEEADIMITTYCALNYTQSNVAKFLESKKWGRIVLDEMQEIRSSTTKIAKACENLRSRRRWMLSGTPLFESIEDLKGELNFLRLEPFAAQNEDGFFDLCITQPWEQHDVRAIETLKALSLVMLRRSKSMTIRATGTSILSLPPLTVEFVPVPQSIAERAVYYYLEHVVSKELRSINRESGEDSDDDKQKKENKSRKLCLRLLREMCNSPVFLNGGLGVNSQLKILNDLLISQARRVTHSSNVLNATENISQANGVPHTSDNEVVMGCDEAILHLAQLQEETRTGEDEVAFLQLGFGQGVTRRARATGSVTAKLQKRQEALNKARAQNSSARSAKAKALWHLALEKVTTGNIPFCALSNVKTEFRAIWRWRFLFCIANNSEKETLPLLLLRGWRPSDEMISTFHLQHPEFYWASPLGLLMKCIPNEASEDEIIRAIGSVLKVCPKQDMKSKAVPFEIKRLSKIDSSTLTWDAYLIFESQQSYSDFLHAASTSRGILVDTEKPVSVMQETLEIARIRYSDAVAAFSIHPTNEHKIEKVSAKRELDKAHLGLRIIWGEGQNTPSEHGVISISLTEYQDRLQIFKSSDSWCKSLATTCLDCDAEILSSAAEIAVNERMLQYLKSSISESVQAMSAFDALVALSEGNFEMTQCPICLEPLGSGDCQVHTEGTLIAMTKCGHLYCAKCLRDYASSQFQPKCPTCRKAFHFQRDVVFVDHLRGSSDDTFVRRQKAKSVAQNASQMLEECNGQLHPEMWEQLYLAIDVPRIHDSNRDIRVSAIPGHFLAHLRSSTGGLPILATPKITNDSGNMSDSLSSKIKALLNDLPRRELSVVFSSCRVTIQHLQYVLGTLGIGYRSLYSGQNVMSTQKAVEEWQSGKNRLSENPLSPDFYPVLLVQAGAAASGLTLTEACKIFLMEPFLRCEEEQQAYARCHRYGQTKPVHVKCYYAPVSVESRLLEWRRKSSDGPTEGSEVSLERLQVVYNTTLFCEQDDEKENYKESDDNQMSFLLGLNDISDNTEKLEP